MKHPEKTKVKDLMTAPPLSMRATDSLALVAREMVLADVRHIPIVDDQRRVIGIVSDRDVLRGQSEANAAALVAGDVMTASVRTVPLTTPAHEAAELMRELKLGALPVIDEDRALAGIVTTIDFLAVARDALRTG